MNYSRRRCCLSSGESCDSEAEDIDTLPWLCLYVLINRRYEVLKPLGFGWCGIVVKAFDHARVEVVAIKIFREGRKYRKVANSELYALDYLSERTSPSIAAFDNIVCYREWFTFANSCCIVFEKLGHSLKHVIKNNPKGLNRKTVITILKSVFIALRTLHENYILHSHLKPSNILRKDNTTFDCKVIAFASSFLPNKFKQGMLMQVPLYRAPEMFLGAPISEKIDIWSVGLITLELLTGNHVLTAKSNNEMMFNYVSHFGIPPRQLLDRSLFCNKYFVLVGSEVKFGRKADGILYGEKCKDLRDSTKIYDDPIVIDFLEKCLHIDPEKRLSAKEALDHPFLSENSNTATACCLCNGDEPKLRAPESSSSETSVYFDALN